MERGSATLLAAIGIAAVVFLAGVVAFAAAMRAEAARVTGAADLVAVAGADAQLRGSDACSAARQASAANRVEIVSCRVTGDEVEFAVSVEVRQGRTRLPGRFRGVAHAGLVTGAGG